MHPVAQEANVSYKMMKKKPQTMAPSSTYQESSAT